MEFRYSLLGEGNLKFPMPLPGRLQTCQDKKQSTHSGKFTSAGTRKVSSFEKDIRAYSTSQRSMPRMALLKFTPIL